MDPLLLTLAISLSCSATAVSVGVIRRRVPTLELEVALQAAILDAHARGKGVVLPVHFLVAALLDDDAAAAARFAGISTAAASAALIAELDGEPPSDPKPIQAFSPELASAYATAPRTAGHVSLPSVLIRLRELLGDAFPTQLQGVDWTRRAPPGAAPTSRGAYRSSGPHLQLVLWNNPRTKFEHVIQILETALGFDKSRAIAHTCRVNFMGASCIGAWPATEALELSRRAIDMSAELGHPLVVSTETDFVPPRPTVGERLRRRLVGTATGL